MNAWARFCATVVAEGAVIRTRTQEIELCQNDVDQKLRSAAEAFERGLIAARTEMETDSRGGAITALQAVWNLCDAFPHWQTINLSLPITALMSALHNLESGQVVPMLKPKMENHRPPEAGFRKVQRAVAIFSVEQIVASGTSKQACRFVVAVLKRGGMPVGSHGETQEWETIRTWRYETTRRDPDDQERDALKAFRNECAISPGMPLDEVKGLITRNLVSFLKAWSVGLG